MPSSSQRAKKQHMVPQSYLARWANHRGQVHIYDMQTDTSRISHIRDVAEQRHFYSGGNVSGVEKWLGDIEEKWVPHLHALADRASSQAARWQQKVLDKQDKNELAGGLVLQLVRTKRIRAMLGIQEEDAARRSHADLMAGPSVLELAVRITSGIWVIGVSTEQGQGWNLYTSDHPVCAVPSGNSDRPSPISDFFLPLDPYHILLVYAASLSPYSKEMDGRVLPMTRSDVFAHNNYQAASAERVVICAMDDFALARAIYVKAKLLERKQS